MIIALATVSANFAQAQNIKGKGDIILCEDLYGKISLGVYIWNYDDEIEDWCWLYFENWSYSMQYNFKLPATDTLRVKFVDMITLDVLSTMTVYGDGRKWNYNQPIFVGHDQILNY